jgi:hypothetical protein
MGGACSESQAENQRACGSGAILSAHFSERFGRSRYGWCDHSERLDVALHHRFGSNRLACLTLICFDALGLRRANRMRGAGENVP